MKSLAQFFLVTPLITTMASSYYDTFNFPIFATRKGLPLHGQYDPVRTFGRNASISLEKLRGICSHYRYIEIFQTNSNLDLFSVACTNMNTTIAVIFRILETNPVWERLSVVGTNGTDIIASLHSRLSFETSTIFLVKDKPEHELQFFGCFIADVIEKFGYDDRNEETIAVINEKCCEDSPSQYQLAKKIKVRLWDLTGGCHNHWMPWQEDMKKHPFDGPIGWNDPFAVYHHRSPKYSSLRWTSASPDLNSCNPLDKIYFGSSVCILEPIWHFENHTQTLNSSFGKCMKSCSSGFEFAMISDGTLGKECVCANGPSKPTNVAVNPDGSCDRCLDAPDQFCGGGAFTSVYDLRKKTSKFKYWQTVKRFTSLYNDIELTFSDPSTMFYLKPSNAKLDECLRECSSHQLAILTEMRGCACISNYRFRHEDVIGPYFDLSRWCVDVPGPCFLFNANIVYWNTDLADSEHDFLMDPAEDYVCQFGQSRSIIGSVNDYAECMEDYPTGRAFWRRKSCTFGYHYSQLYQSCLVETCSELKGHCDCIDDQGTRWISKHNTLAIQECSGVASGSQFWYCQDNGQFLTARPKRNGCRQNVICDEMKNHCNCNDDTGTEWIVPFGVKGEKPCPESFFGTQTWICDRGMFITDVPNRDNCIEKWIEDLLSEFEKISSNVIAEEINHQLELGGPVSGLGLEMLAAIQIDTIFKRRNETDSQKTSYEFTNKILDNTDFLLGSKSSWLDSIGQELNVWNTTTNLIKGIQASGAQFLTELQDGVIEREGRNMYSVFRSVDVSSNPEDILFQGNDNFWRSQILIPKELVGNLGQSKTIRTVGTSFYFNDTDVERLPRRLPNDSSDSLLIPYMIDYSLPGLEIQNLTDNQRIQISFNLTSTWDDYRPTCVFWDMDALAWNTDGCLEATSDDKITCKCNHLTDFSLIMGVVENEHDEKWNYIKDMLSNVLGLASIISLMITQLLKHCVQPIKNMRFAVEINRNYCLIVALTLFLFVADWKPVVEHEIGCTLVTGLNHFVWLSVFAWTALEGHMLYRALIVVFDTGSHRELPLYLFGYLVPIVISVVTAVVATMLPEYPIYHFDELCWLKGNLRWAFMGPVIIVLCGNGGMLVVGLRIHYRVVKEKNIKRTQRLKSWMSSCLTLSMLLGMTWILGFINGISTVIDFAFIILNCSTGIFIFTNRILMNKKMIEAAQSKISATSSKYLMPSFRMKSKLPSSNKGNRSTTRTTNASNKNIPTSCRMKKN